MIAAVIPHVATPSPAELVLTGLGANSAFLAPHLINASASLLMVRGGGNCITFGLMGSERQLGGTSGRGFTANLVFFGGGGGGGQRGEVRCAV